MHEKILLLTKSYWEGKVIIFHFTAPVNNLQPVLNHPENAFKLAKQKH